MPKKSNNSESGMAPVDHIIAEFLMAVESGHNPNPDEYLTRFPQFASELKEFFSGYEVINLVACGIPNHADSTGVGKSELSDTRPPESADKRKPMQVPRTLGRYRLQRLLGKGAMGAVFLANDLELGRHVALKVPTVDMSDDPTLRERFYREARAAARLQHPNICTVYEVGEAKGFQFIAMSYVPGAPLSRFVKSEEPLTLRKVALVIKKLALALHDAHQVGIVHRDLKPDNIMINKSGEPVIMDFGLARLNRLVDDVRVTRTGMIIGSPAYMSPEQVMADHEAIGPATDIYSLGVVMFELLTGRLPFTGNGKVLALIAQVQRDRPPPPSDFRVEIPPELDHICLQMLEKSVTDRQTSMKEVAQQLTEFLAGRFFVPDPAGTAPLSVPLEASAESDTLAWIPSPADENCEKHAEAQLSRVDDEEIVFASATSSCGETEANAIDPTGLRDHALAPTRQTAGSMQNSKRKGARVIGWFAAGLVLVLATGWGIYEHGYRSNFSRPTKAPNANVELQSEAPAPAVIEPVSTEANPVGVGLTGKDRPNKSQEKLEPIPQQIKLAADPGALPCPELVLMSSPHRSSLINGGILLHLGVRNENRFPRGIKLRAQVFDDDDQLLLENTLTDVADLRGRFVVKLAADQMLPERVRLKLTDLEKQVTAVSEFVSTSTVTGIGTVSVPIIAGANRGLHDDLQVSDKVQVRQSGLTELTTGSHIFAGVQFQIEDGIIELQSISTPALPAAVYDLRLDQQVARMHFLLACPVAEPCIKNGDRVAQIQVNYKSGEQDSIPIQYGVHMESWYSDLPKTPLSSGTLAWIGANRDSLTRAAAPLSVRLFVTSWTNPRFDARIDSIDILPNKSTASFVCVAVAVESSDESEAFTEKVEIAPLAIVPDAGAAEWQQAQRDVVNWALSVGGVVFISGRAIPVTKFDKLPAQFSVTSLGFESSELTDHDLERFRLLTKLTYLQLKKASVHGTGFTHLSGLPELSHLVLDGSEIEDEGLSFLESLPALQQLELQETKITDSGLSHLAACPSLNQLRVSRAVLTDAGVANLKAMSKLQHLSCDGDEASIKRIAGELSLTELTLQSPRDPVIAIAALTRMSSLRNLTVLGIAGSDGLLRTLAKLKQIRHLTVSGLSIGNLTQLRDMLTNCKVESRK